MPNPHLHRWAMFSGAGASLKKAEGGRTKTLHQSIKSLTTEFSHVTRHKLPGWGPCDYHNLWLETLDGILPNHLQWYRCIHISSSPELWDSKFLTIFFCFYFLLFLILLLPILFWDCVRQFYRCVLMEHSNLNRYEYTSGSTLYLTE